MVQVNGCLLEKRTSLFQSSNRIFSILLARMVIFFNHIAVGMHLLSILLYYFDTMFLHFQLIVSGILFHLTRSNIAGCDFLTNLDGRSGEKPNISDGLIISGSK